MKSFDWDNLRIFLATARAHSAVEASRILGLSQSTVSRRIQKLEVETGTVLFNRSAQGLRLTQAGQKLLEHIEGLEDTLSTMELNVFGDNRALTGEVRLGTTEGFGAYFVAPHMERFCAQHPGITVDILSLPRSLNLSKREADIAIAIDRPVIPNIVTTRLTDYRMLPYASAAYLDRHPEIKTPDDFKAHRWIDYIDDLIFSPSQFSVQTWLPGVKPSLRCTGVIAQAQAVRSGSGIAVLPCFIASLYDELLPILPDSTDIIRTFWLVSPPERRELARVRALWDYLRVTVEAKKDLMMGGRFD
ncbi:TPA: LysR family transcriptional regulator [Raoultella planticola]|nr:LysR family transcriptional regulator [Raoultella planticola]